ncbi:adenylate cyclase [Andreprevotia lacus DSM 23236]|jgi:adenylate cyclase|uniref:Adenylate cyclase n=1 Tax=Andreprevotia lacus DSM 23236 TaxID=1121001 RepID=A0A1W1XB72_9NEIS|nr:CYTH domain-containing protein [Andreprevotia lacus]SMC21117.1 adenylate cyclase [Andreprevotia lacus DSM 23236]
MATEIERKFLLASDDWRSLAHKATRIAQGYLNTDPARTVRVRIKGSQGFLTIKGKNEGIARAEFEYEVPLADAEAMLALCPNVLDKTRHLVEFGGFLWEIDEFHGDNAGLIVAEIELPAVDTTFAKPEWLGNEVSGDARYYNSALSNHPYTQWS